MQSNLHISQKIQHKDTNIYTIYISETSIAIHLDART